MTLAEAIAEIQLSLGFRSDLATTITNELRSAQAKLEGGILARPGTPTFLPWFLVSEVSEWQQLAGEERVPVPDDFLAEVEEDALWLKLTTDDGRPLWKLLEKVDRETGRRGPDMPGEPGQYALLGSYFRLFPMPNKTYRLKLIYFQRDTFPATGSETNRWLTHAPSVLVAQAGQAMAQAFNHVRALEYHRAEFEREAWKLFVMTDNRSHSQRSYQMGGPD